MHRLTACLLLGAAMAAAQTPAIKSKPAVRTSPASGEQMYISYCASCHGKDGKGSGPAAAALKKMPTDLTSLTRSNGGQFPALRVRASVVGDAAIQSHGSAQMPVWGTLFRSMGDDAQTSLRLSNLIAHIEKIQQK